MNAKEYLEVRSRMTRGCTIGCLNCPLSNEKNGKGLECPDLENTYPDIAVEIVEKWNKENPTITNLDVFKKEVEKYIKNTFKDIKLKLYCSKNMPYLLCPNFSNCEDCKESWNSEYKGDEK